MERSQLWHAPEKRVAPAQCASIIERALRLPAKPATVGVERSVAPTTRRCELRWIDREDETFSDVRNLILRRIENANRNLFGFEISYLPNLQFTTYRNDGGGGHYDWHTDDDFWRPIGGSRMTVRKLSCVLVLSASDDYDGGDLEIEGANVGGQMRDQGAMVAFPSFLRHRVTAVTRGVRHSLVAWMEGPRWR